MATDIAAKKAVARETFDSAALQLKKDGLQYNDINAERLIFAMALKALKIRGSTGCHFRQTKAKPC